MTATWFSPRKRFAAFAMAFIAGGGAANAAPFACADVFGTSARGKAQEAAHNTITHDLFNGTVIEAEKFSANENRNPIWKVKIKVPGTGRVRTALFKPRQWGDGFGWNRTPMEYVAYALNRKLGMDLVPPVAYRRNLKINGQTFAEGALLYFVPDAHNLKPVSRENWGAAPELFAADTRVLDILLANPDRHEGNFMRGRHWVDGEYRPILIDHAASLKGPAPQLAEENPLFSQDGGVQALRSRTLAAVKALSIDDLKEFSEFMSETEMLEMLKRRDALVAQLEKLKIVD